MTQCTDQTRVAGASLERPSFSARHRLRRALPLLLLSTTLAACSNGLDLDLRGTLGGSVDTSQAAIQATGERPKPDSRGIIAYPSYQVAVARRNDTVTDIASRIGLPAEELARFNGLRADDRLRRGEIVALPRRVAEPAPGDGGTPEVDVAALAGAAIDRAADTSQAGSGTTGGEGVEPIRHQVARGETAFTIARLYQVSPRSLAEWNALERDFAVREGQYLLIPVKAEVPRPTTSETAVAEPGSGSATPTPPSAAQPLPEPVAVTPSVPAAPQVEATPVAPATPTPPAAPQAPVADIGQDATPAAPATASMIMPVQGAIIREYAKGRNEGIDIAAAPGQPVKAAASGRVASISTTTEGVRLLLIRHPDDVITVYTHIDDISVSKGDAVSRGQNVARVAAGNPSFLHFEVRKGFDSTDPMAFLR